jgi:hypothetical protein
MGKTLLLISMLLAAPGTIPNMGSASITWNPKDPKRGEEATIETDGIPEGTVVKIEWNPPGEPSSGVVGPDGRITVKVPANAETVIASEPESGAEAAAVCEQ